MVGIMTHDINIGPLLYFYLMVKSVIKILTFFFFLWILRCSCHVDFLYIVISIPTSTFYAMLTSFAELCPNRYASECTISSVGLITRAQQPTSSPNLPARLREFIGCTNKV